MSRRKLTRREEDDAWDAYMPDAEDEALLAHVFDIEPQGLHQGKRRIQDDLLADRGVRDDG